MRQGEKSVQEQAMDRVSAMTEAGQQRPEVKDDEEHRQFALYSRVAVADGQYGHTALD